MIEKSKIIKLEEVLEIKNKKENNKTKCRKEPITSIGIVKDIKIRKTKTREVIEFFIEAEDDMKLIARYYVSKKNKSMTICELDEILVSNNIKMINNFEFISNRLLKFKLNRLIGKKLIYHEKYNGFYLVKELLPLSYIEGSFA